jgi:hypothetical protein
MTKLFAGFDLDDFWENSAYARKEYVSAPFTATDLKLIEQDLGYKSYVALMQFQNGGIPKRTNHKTKTPTSWSEDHVALTGIFGIGTKKDCTLCGELGSKFWMDEWGYPAIGIYFADCPSAGHDMLCLDYSKCGPTGEPEVVHIDQEDDFKVTFVAKNFESFIRGLQDEDDFE